MDCKKPADIMFKISKIVKNTNVKIEKLTHLILLNYKETFKIYRYHRIPPGGCSCRGCLYFFSSEIIVKSLTVIVSWIALVYLKFQSWKLGKKMAK